MLNLTFDPEDKIRWEELAPSLQDILNKKANITNLTQNSTISLSGDASGSSLIPYNQTNTLNVHVYRTDLAYNIPSEDVGGNIWMEERSD